MQERKNLSRTHDRPRGARRTCATPPRVRGERATQTVSGKPHLLATVLTDFIQAIFQAVSRLVVGWVPYLVKRFLETPVNAATASRRGCTEAQVHQPVGENVERAVTFALAHVRATESHDHKLRTTVSDVALSALALEVPELVQPGSQKLLLDEKWVGVGEQRSLGHPPGIHQRELFGRGNKRMLSASLEIFVLSVGRRDGGDFPRR